MNHSLQNFKTEPECLTLVAFGKEYLDFQMLKPFDLSDLDGNIILENISPERKWRVRRFSYNPPQYHYILSLGQFHSEKAARKVLNKQKITDIHIEIRCLGGQISVNHKNVAENICYEVIMGGFNTKEEAFEFQTRHSHLPLFMKKEIIREARGVVEVCDDVFSQSAQIDNGIKILPRKSDSKIRIYGTSISRKHHRIMPTQTSYRGSMMFRINAKGGVDAIHQFSLETMVTSYSQVIRQRQHHNFQVVLRDDFEQHHCLDLLQIRSLSFLREP